MPALTIARQPDAAARWFASEAGQALLASELPALYAALEARPGLPWLVFSAVPRTATIDPPHGLWLCPDVDGWRGEMACGAALPIATESIGAIVLQHVEDASVDAWLAECTRVLVPGGRLGVLALNPLSPYRGHWIGEGVGGREPVTWRRRLMRAGLVPDPVAQGLGPRWRTRIEPGMQHGAGARAAYLLSAQKRRLPMTLKRLPALRPALGDAA